MTYKAHPVTIIQFLKPYLFVFVLPFIRSVLVYLKKGTFKVFFSVEVVVLLLIIVLAVLRWRAISITDDGKEIIIKKGFLVKNCTVITKHNISCINLKQNISDYIFGSTTVFISTEAGRPKNTNFVFKLSKEDAKGLTFSVFNNETTSFIKFSAFRVSLYALTSTSAITGIIVTVPLIKNFGEMLDVAASDILIKKINDISSNLNNIFPPVINIVIILLISACIASFLSIFFKNIDFRVSFGQNSIKTQKGFITRQNTTINTRNVNNISFEQTPLMRIFKKHSIRITVGGYTDKREKSVIVPIASREEIEKCLKMQFSLFKEAKWSIPSQQAKASLRRLLFIPTLIASLIIGLTVMLILFFRRFDQILFFMCIIAMGIDVYYASVCYHHLKSGIVCMNDNICASGSNGFCLKKICCDKSKVGKIKILQTPTDKRYKTCKVKLAIRSKIKDIIKIKNISVDTVAKQIKDAFGVSIDV